MLLKCGIVLMNVKLVNLEEILFKNFFLFVERCINDIVLLLLYFYVGYGYIILEILFG